MTNAKQLANDGNIPNGGGSRGCVVGGVPINLKRHTLCPFLVGSSQYMATLNSPSKLKPVAGANGDFNRELRITRIGKLRTQLVMRACVPRNTFQDECDLRLVFPLMMTAPESRGKKLH